MKAGAKGNTKKVDERSVPSIFSRPFDLLLCFVFLVKAIIAAYSDIMNAIGPIEGKMSPETVKDYAWPPKMWWDMFWWWTDLADPHLRVNPVWMKVGCALSAYVYTPFYFVAIYAFVKGRNWIRDWVLMWGWGMILTVVFVLSELTLSEKHYSNNLLLAYIVYGAYILFPFFAMIRVWPRNVFGLKQKNE